MNAADHAAVAIARANRTAAHLRENADLLARHGVNIEAAIVRIMRAATSGDPAYVALDPICNLGDRITRISDRINGTVVRGNIITTRSGFDDDPDGDLLAAIGLNLVSSIPCDVELYVPPAASVLRQR